MRRIVSTVMTLMMRKILFSFVEYYFYIGVFTIIFPVFRYGK